MYLAFGLEGKIREFNSLIDITGWINTWLVNNPIASHLHTYIIFYTVRPSFALLCQLHFRLLFSVHTVHGGWCRLSTVAHRASARSPIRYGSMVVWYIVSLEFVNGEFMYVYKLSSILYMDMPSVFSCSCVGRPHPFLHASSVQCLTLVSIHSQ